MPATLPWQPVRLVAAIVLGLAAADAAAGQAGPGIEERPAVTAAVAASAAAAASDASIAVFEQLQQYQQQIEALTGRIEQLEHALAQAREQEKARYLDTDTRLRQLEQAPKAAATSEPSAAVVATPVATGAGNDEKALFERARALVRDKKYDEAIAAFGEQVKLFPTGELFPSALYWLGEMWLAATTPDEPKAGRYFYRVYNEFPKNNWAPTAMYRHGQLQCSGAEATKGRLTLARVMSQYAASPEAKQAEAALRQCQ